MQSAAIKQLENKGLVVQSEDSGQVTKLVRPLPEKLEHFFSSDDYTDLVCSVFGPTDLIVTYKVRYPGVIQSILSGSSTVGPVIEATAKDWKLALLLFLPMLAASTYSLYQEYQAKEDAHKRNSNSYSQMHSLLKPNIPKEQKEEKKVGEAEEDIKAYNKRIEEVIAEMNENIALELKEMGAKEYQSIKLCYLNKGDKQKIQPSDIKIEYNFVKTTPEGEEIERPGKIRRFFSNLYKASSLSSYAYWILFIATSIVVGNFADAGIAGISAWLGFGLPIAVGLGIPIIKARNWLRHGGGVSDEEAQLTKTAETDTPVILEKVMKRIQYKHQVEELKKEYTSICGGTLSETESAASLKAPQDSSFGAQPAVQAAAALYTSVVSNYGMTQYNAWIISDFLKVVPNLVFAPICGPIIGSLLIAVGLGFGIYDMVTKYREAKKAAAAAGPEALGPQQPLEDIFKERCDTLNELKKTLAARMEKLGLTSENIEQSIYAKIVKSTIPEPPASMSLGSMAYRFFDWTATGIFFGRLGLTAGAAVFLPFAAAALSNPVTIGLIVFSGLLYCGIKAYQAYQKKKETDAVEYIEKIKDMDKQIVLATLAGKNVEKKIELKSQNRHSTEIEVESRHDNRSVVAFNSNPNASPSAKSHSVFGQGLGQNAITQPKETHDVQSGFSLGGIAACT